MEEGGEVNILDAKVRSLADPEIGKLNLLQIYPDDTHFRLFTD